MFNRLGELTMLTNDSSVKRHDVSITYTRARAMDGADDRAAILGVKRAGRERVKRSLHS